MGSPCPNKSVVDENELKYANFTKLAYFQSYDGVFSSVLWAHTHIIGTKSVGYVKYVKIWGHLSCALLCSICGRTLELFLQVCLI